MENKKKIFFFFFLVFPCFYFASRRKEDEKAFLSCLCLVFALFFLLGAQSNKAKKPLFFSFSFPASMEPHGPRTPFGCVCPRRRTQRQDFSILGLWGVLQPSFPIFSHLVFNKPKKRNIFIAAHSCTKDLAPSKPVPYYHAPPCSLHGQ